MKRLVLVGAGHAHLATIHGIAAIRRRGVAVTVIDPEENLWYSGMAPAGVGGGVADRALHIPVAELVRRAGGQFVRDRVSRIDAEGRRVDVGGRSLSFDVLSCAIGSRVDAPIPVLPGAPPPIGVKPIRALITDATERSTSGSSRIVIIGGGPSAVELAGAFLTRGAAVTVVTGGAGLARRLPAKAGRIALDNLLRRGADVRFDSPVSAIDPSGVVVPGGHIRADRVVLATGLRVGALFAESGLPVAPDGALRVDRTLRVPGTPVFAGGDCADVADYALQRAGVHAIRQGPVLRRNILAMLRDETARLDEYTPPPSLLLILNLGDGSAICTRQDRVRYGRWCATLKLRIDWAFVRSRGRRIVPSLLGPPRRRDA